MHKNIYLKPTHTQLTARLSILAGKPHMVCYRDVFLFSSHFFSSETTWNKWAYVYSNVSKAGRVAINQIEKFQCAMQQHERGVLVWRDGDTQLKFMWKLQTGFHFFLLDQFVVAVAMNNFSLRPQRFASDFQKA